jgi:hypothetical protein
VKLYIWEGNRISDAYHDDGTLERFVGTTRVLIHANRKIDHPVTAPRKVSPPSESELRALHGDR